MDDKAKIVVTGDAGTHTLNVSTEDFLEIEEEVYVIAIDDGGGKPTIGRRLITGYRLHDIHGWIYMSGDEELLPSEAYKTIDEAVIAAEKMFLAQGWCDGSPLKTILEERYGKK